MVRALGGAVGAIVLAATTSASAGGLDRTVLSVAPLFEDGNYAELTLGYADPSVSGVDTGSIPIGNVAGGFDLPSAALKLDLNDKFSVAMMVGEPYGSDVVYPGTGTATTLSGTSAVSSSYDVTMLLRYKLNDRISVYGGPHYVSVDGDITLSGSAYPFPVSVAGYNVTLKDASGWGYVIGAAYEIPDIALRVSLTYSSETDLGFTTNESIGGAPVATGGTINTVSPQVINLEAQSGVAANTLVFGGVRWSEWSKFSLIPQFLGQELAELDNATTYTLGVGHKFSDKFSGSVSIIYEDGGPDNLVSPLTPVNGSTAIALGGKYEVNDMLTLSGGIRYTYLGNAQPEVGTPDVAFANFTDNNAVSVGIKIGYHF